MPQNSIKISLYLIGIDFLLFIYRQLSTIWYYTKISIFTFLFKLSLILQSEYFLSFLLPDKLTILLDYNNIFDSSNKIDLSESSSDCSDDSSDESSDDIYLALKKKLRLYPEYDTIIINYSQYKSNHNNIFSFAFLIYLKYFDNNFNTFLKILYLVNYNNSNLNNILFTVYFNIDNRKYINNYIWRCSIPMLEQIDPDDELIIKPMGN